MSQLIISIGRESGSGGLEIAQTLAKRFGLPLYDKSILQNAAEAKGLDAKDLEQYDERPRSPLFYRSIKGFSNAPEDSVAQMQFDLLRRHAAAGESFVVLGRCAEEVLADYECLVSIFVGGDISKKAERVMKYYNMSEKEAREFMKEKDKRRKQYHNRYCEIAWGDSRNYDLSINSSRLGVDGTLQTLIQYVDARIAVM